MAEAGLVLIDKPSGLTSHDVVAKLRKKLGSKKIGHAGTLDPMATGLLVLGVETGTKLLTFLIGLDKTYEATIRLGSATVSDDKESETVFVAQESDLENLTDGQIADGIRALTGEIEQVPSMVSAIKVNGERAYDLVRSGEQVELKSRKVKIHLFDVLGEMQRGQGFIDIPVRVSCSSGTYIRALARDLGRALGVGGHLTALTRTSIGEFELSAASSLDEESPAITPLATAARRVFPSLELSEHEVVDLRHGKRIRSRQAASFPCAGFAPSGELVAVLERMESELKSVVVFPA